LLLKKNAIFSPKIGENRRKSCITLNPAEMAWFDQPVDDIFYLIFEDLYQGTHEQKYPFNVLCDG
jgi:hypothetical protein